MKSLVVYAQLVRLPNTFTAWADIMLGALATGWLAQRWRGSLPLWQVSDRTASFAADSELRQWGIFVCLLSASTLLYWSGMIWNDYFDLAQDRIERPARPLASGRVLPRTALWLGLGCMAVGLLLTVGADLLQRTERWRSAPVAVALVCAIFLYDGLFKKTWAGPILMGMCRALNILLGLSVLGVWPPLWGWLLAFVIGLYICGVTWFARTEARLSSQSMLIGAAVVMLLSLALALSVPAVALEASEHFQPSLLFPYLLAAFGGYLGVAVFRAIRQPLPSRVQPAIKRAILGLVVLDALLASAFVGSAGLLLALLLIPGMILARWLYST